ncbi:bis(5'-nucleosyl)-tetraphosphatase [Pediococcus pentosaceus]|uniref:bis(5'-nucleosyl)-tetraphosphatase n=1 Tax=Pediococcus pentosaceus TaxID=1255 RepID=UPI0003C33705|nr:bis(5'-nucleosyl)-tetraphosphatase [Pediococcus pentosaceus]AHA04618.1 NUDIX hydrolase [Pediococcus pentosaceus SL4]KAF0523069.1 NUDIX domain-containing protein [Pediococcus pentosaceus]
MALELDGGAVVYQLRNNQPYYLLLESATSGFWGFPKGHVEDKESVIEAAQREIREETGIITKVNDNFFEVLSYQVGKNLKKVTLFSAEVPLDTTLRLQEAEISSAGWFDYITVREKLSYLNLKQALDKADHFIASIKPSV